MSLRKREFSELKMWLKMKMAKWLSKTKEDKREVEAREEVLESLARKLTPAEEDPRKPLEALKNSLKS
jgi:hypothetical protein